MEEVRRQWEKRWGEIDFAREYKEIYFEPFGEIFSKAFKKGDKVLEAGCGLGRYCLWLKKRGIRAYGIDISKEAIRRAKKIPGINFVRGDVCKLPYKNDSFDGYISLGVIEHFKNKTDVEKSFLEAYRVLKPGGCAVFAVPNPNSLVRLYVRFRLLLGSHEAVRHYPIYERDIVEAGEKAGFETVRVSYKEFYYPFYLLVRRILGRENLVLRRLLRRVLNIFDFFKVVSSGICVELIKPPEVSVIILNYNGKKFIKECVDSVVKSFKGEIIVVDNASTDGSFEYLKKIYGGKIRLFRSEKQLYFTGGCNFGARKARGEELVFLNSDCVVMPRWINEMVKFAQGYYASPCTRRCAASHHPCEIIVQPKILKYDKQTIDNVGTTYNIFGFARSRGHGERDLGQYDKNEEVEICAGTCFMIDKKFFLELGGFDERYKYQYEDVDLNLRAKKMGGKSFYCYKSVIYHKGGETFKENVSEDELLFNIRKNRLMTALKNFSGWRGRAVTFFVLAGIVALDIKERRRMTMKILEAVIDEVNLRIKVKEITNLVKKGRFLDVGCGKGSLMARLPYDSFGVDPKFKGAKIFNISFEKLKTDLKFDVIGFYESLEHMDDPRAALIKARGLLTKSGVLVVEVPLFDNFVAKFLGKKYFGFNDPGHKHFFKKKEIYELLNLAGFKPLFLGFTYLKFPLSGVGISWKIFPVLCLKILNFLTGKREFLRIYATKEGK